jgi:hypothetical protein
MTEPQVASNITVNSIFAFGSDYFAKQLRLKLNLESEHLRNKAKAVLLHYDGFCNGCITK